MPCGNSSGATLGGVCRRLASDRAPMAVGRSGIGASSQCQKRVSSITSQLLHLPITASANTPEVGMLMRMGGAASMA